jgi:3-oxoacyl-[acyl-carrier protein] reductase
VNLQKRFAIVTGANQGLGLAIAEAYLAAGVAGLAICARGEAKLREAETSLKLKLAPGQRLLALTCDIADIKQIDLFIEKVAADFGRIDILVNNAGVYGPFGALEDLNWQEWVEAININLNGLVYVCRSVIPSMKKAGYGKIINLSGGGATNPLPRISSYAASKAGVVRFTDTLGEELRGHRIDVNAVAPGLLDTRLTDQLLEAGPEVVGEDFFNRIKNTVAEGKAAPVEKAADLCVFLGSAMSDGLTGKLISAPWDPWPEFEGHRREIENNDIYTLRRILPKDRGQNWGN